MVRWQPTSQLNTVDYEEIIQEEFHRGNDVLILSFSSALSGSYNSARLGCRSNEWEKNIKFY